MQENELTRPKKVLHLITKGTWGGAQAYVYTLATSLPMDQFESHVAIGTPGELNRKLGEQGIPVHQIDDMQRDISLIKEIRSFFALLKLLKTERPDILHTNSSKAGLLGALAGKIARVPRIIFTGHGWSSNEKRPWIIQKFFLLLHFKTIFLSDRTICVSKKTKNDITRFSFLRKKTCVIYNGIKPFETKSREMAREKIRSLVLHISEENNPLWIGTISELHPNKGLDLIVKALAQITTPFLFFIIGEGEQRKALQNLIQELGLQEKVFLVGSLLDAKEYLSAFDIFTLTSRTEALPYVLLEAGVARLPVLATRVGGIPEIITNGTNGILVRPYVSEILLGLNHMLNQPTKRQEYGRFLAEKIEKDFSIHQQITQTVRVYNGSF